MNALKIFRNCKEVKGLRVHITPHKGILCNECSLWLYKKFYKYIPIVGLNYYSPREILRNCSHGSNISSSNKIWVHPKSRISRDILRQSGYVITLDKDKADVRIIPDINEQYNQGYVHSECLVYNTTSDKMYMVHIYCTTGESDYSKYVSAVQDSISNFLGVDKESLEFYNEDNLTGFPVYLLPNEEEYFNIIENRVNNPWTYRKKYCIDSLVPTTAINSINIESLEMARRIDMIALEKFISSCDWKKYPLTLHTFLMGSRKDARLIGNSNAKMVLSEIYFGYEYPSQHLVTREDWDMLQSWILHLVGIDDKNTGYISTRNLNSLDNEYKKFLLQKSAVSRVNINEDCTLSEIKDVIIDKSK